MKDRVMTQRLQRRVRLGIGCLYVWTWGMEGVDAFGKLLD
jgi:hypothetical protein